MNYGNSAYPDFSQTSLAAVCGSFKKRGCTRVWCTVDPIPIPPATVREKGTPHDHTIHNWITYTHTPHAHAHTHTHTRTPHAQTHVP